jgi:hypothetical protein
MAAALAAMCSFMKVIATITGRPDVARYMASLFTIADLSSILKRRHEAQYQKNVE